MSFTRLIKWLAVAWTVIIFIGCTLPGGGPPDDIPYSDKIKHILIFALWAFLWKKASALSAQLLFWIGVGYGLFIEFLQLVMPINRSFEWLDLAADAVGVLAGLAVSAFLWPVLFRK